MVAIRPAAPVVAMEPVAPTVSQPVPQSEQRQALPSISAPDDETGFCASIAEDEVSQLQEGVTLWISGWILGARASDGKPRSQKCWLQDPMKNA